MYMRCARVVDGLALDGLAGWVLAQAVPYCEDSLNGDTR